MVPFPAPTVPGLTSQVRMAAWAGAEIKLATARPRLVVRRVARVTVDNGSDEVFTGFVVVLGLDQPAALGGFPGVWQRMRSSEWTLGHATPHNGGGT